MVETLTTFPSGFWIETMEQLELADKIVCDNIPTLEMNRTVLRAKAYQICQALRELHQEDSLFLDQIRVIADDCLDITTDFEQLIKLVAQAFVLLETWQFCKEGYSHEEGDSFKEHLSKCYECGELMVMNLNLFFGVFFLDGIDNLPYKNVRFHYQKH